ncbi:MAG: LysM peptidoglycan-binding domain-containing protein [Planctomycetota bacterium]
MKRRCMKDWLAWGSLVGLGLAACLPLAGCVTRDPLPAVVGPSSWRAGGGYDPIEVPPTSGGPDAIALDEGPAAEDPVKAGVATQPADTAATVVPADPTPAPAESRMYTIRKGDRLWVIAQREYGDGQRWVDILAANPGLDPKRMTVGDEIVLPE